MQEFFLRCECNHNIKIVYLKIRSFRCNFHRSSARVKKENEHPRDVSMTSQNGSRYKAKHISMCTCSFFLFTLRRSCRQIFLQPKKLKFPNNFCDFSISDSTFVENTWLVYCPLNFWTVQRPRAAIKPLISFMMFMIFKQQMFIRYPFQFIAFY